MAQLGAAVKHNRARYPLYALFRRVVVRRELHQYVWGKRKRRTFDQLKQHLVGMGDLLRCLVKDTTGLLPW
jgi:DNA-binding winged helix-turn-helix (wHTH) protein